MAREEGLLTRHICTAEAWTEHTKRLPPLKVGDMVRVKNQTGSYPKKCDRTGSVVEVRQHDQYMVKIDGSGRVTHTQNQRFLRKHYPIRNDQLPSRLICDYLATRNAMPEPLPDLGDAPVTGTPPALLPVLTLAGPARGSVKPTSVGARHVIAATDGPVPIHQGDQCACLAQGLLNGLDLLWCLWALCCYVMNIALRALMLLHIVRQ